MAAIKKNVVRLNPASTVAKQVLSNRIFTETPLNPLEEPPSYMTPEAADIYRKLISEMSEKPDMQDTDKYVLQMLADSIANYRAVRTLINSTGELVENRQGSTVSNPARFALNGERSAIMGITVQLKMTPKSRAETKKAAAEPETKSQNVSVDF